MKYDALLGDLKSQLITSKNILITLPSQANVDHLAAGLSLYLSLLSSSKEAQVVTEDSLKVSHSSLFGVGQIQSSLLKTSGGNLTITLEGVVASDGTVPSLEKLDWFPQGGNLNLVFHVLSGQRFEPSRIIPSYQGGSFDLIFTVGSSNLNSLGGIYTNNEQSFSGVTIVNIDNSSANSQYGQINVVDPEASCLSEMVAQIISDLGLHLDSDSATNILTGVYSATSNLTQGVSSETFMVVSQAVQAGGKIPTQAVPPAHEYSQQFPPLNQVFGFPVNQPVSSPGGLSPVSESYTVPPVVNQERSGSNQPASPLTPPGGSATPVGGSSTEEVPQGEFALSSNPETAKPEPDWLTPKVFKGGSIG